MLIVSLNLFNPYELPSKKIEMQKLLYVRIRVKIYLLV